LTTRPKKKEAGAIRGGCVGGKGALGRGKGKRKRATLFLFFEEKREGLALIERIGKKGEEKEASTPLKGKDSFLCERALTAKKKRGEKTRGGRAELDAAKGEGGGGGGKRSPIRHQPGK